MAKSETNNKRTRTIYNPKVGCKYRIRNVQTGEILIGSTLTIRDPDQKPWRSPKDTPQGHEFFKMKTGTKREGFTYYKFMNSNLNGKCLSEDGQWEFVGQTGDGYDINKVNELKNKKEETKKIVAHVNSTATSQEVEVVEEQPTPEDIREDIMNSEYSNASALDKLMNE